MAVIGFVLKAMSILVATLFSRLVRGRTLPSWSLKSEVSVNVFRYVLKLAATKEPDWFRKFQASLDLKSNLTDAQINQKEQVEAIDVEWFIPRDEADDRNVVLYLHGGGYVYGSIDGYRAFLVDLAVKSKTRVLAVDYRLAPEHKFPSAQQDVETIYSWLVAKGFPPKRIGIAGDSAGGGLTMSLLFSLKMQKRTQPAFGLLFSPWVNPTAEGGSMRHNEAYDIFTQHWLQHCFEQFIGDHDKKDPLVSAVNGDVDSLCPLYMTAGDAELFIDQIEALHNKVLAAGGDSTLDRCVDMVHDFPILMRDLDVSQQTMSRVISHMHKHYPSSS